MNSFVKLFLLRKVLFGLSDLHVPVTLSQVLVGGFDFHKPPSFIAEDIIYNKASRMFIFAGIVTYSKPLNFFWN